MLFLALEMRRFGWNQKTAIHQSVLKVSTWLEIAQFAEHFKWYTKIYWFKGAGVRTEL
jgi:hypothetical protein